MVALGPATSGARSSQPPTPRDEQTSRAKASAAHYEDRLFALVNGERKRRGLPGLRRGACAAKHAERWSAELARTQRLRHQSVKSMLRACDARKAAENIAFGDVSAEEFVRTWMRSRGHRRNILDPDLRYAAIAAKQGKNGKWYIVQDFLGY
jgi:uncharacterized protein YkwD